MKPTDSENYWRLRKMMIEFEKLDKDFLAKTKSENLADAIMPVIEAKKEIKRFLADRPSFQASGDLEVKLKKIRDNDGYIIDEVCELVEEKLGIAISQEAEDEIDWMDALFEKGTAGYVDWEFFRRRNQVGSIIASQTLPDIFLHHLDKLKECYALGLFEATIIYCRAVIESGGFEALKRKGEIRSTKKEADIREYSLKALIKSIKRYVSRTNYDEAKDVIEYANNILHSKRKKIVVSENDAYDSIRSTFSIIEELFR
jgi:hypothetical protein